MSPIAAALVYHGPLLGEVSWCQLPTAMYRRVALKGSSPSLAAVVAVAAAAVGTRQTCSLVGRSLVLRSTLG